MKSFHSPIRSGLFDILPNSPLSASSAGAIRGLGDERGWWCPSLDTINAGTITLADLSGNGKVGTLINMEPESDWTLDDAKYCLSFGGTDEQVTAAEAVSLNSNVSISLWVKVASANNGAFIKVGGSTGLGIGVGDGTLVSSGLILTLAYEGVAWLNSGYSFSTNTWTHVTATKSSANLLEVFINGVSVYSLADVAVSSTGTLTTFIGGYDPGDPRYATAKLDDIRLFDRVLSGAEITALASTRGYRT